MIIVWSHIAVLVYAGMSKNGRYFTSNLYSLLYFSQYVIGILFYKNKFFDNSMKSINKNKLLLILYVVATVVSVILSSTSVILLVKNFKINIYSNLYNYFNSTGKILLCTLLFLDKFFSYNIYFINVITFSSIIISHSLNIRAYQTKFDKLVNENINDITITDVMQEFTQIKSYHSESVEMLNNLFSSATLLGLTGSYFVIMNYDTEFVTVFSYIDTICFLLIEAIYIYSINRISVYVGSITNIISSPKFVTKFLHRSDLNNVYGDIYSSEFEEDINKSNDEKNKKAKSPRVIDDDIIISMKSQMNLKNKKKTDLDEKIDLIKNMTFRDIILSHENGVSLDWLILNNKLSEQWESFSILGFTIDNTELLQKALLIVLGLFGILNLNEKFGL